MLNEWEIDEHKAHQESGFDMLVDVIRVDKSAGTGAKKGAQEKTEAVFAEDVPCRVAAGQFEPTEETSPASRTGAVSRWVVTFAQYQNIRVTDRLENIRRRSTGVAIDGRVLQIVEVKDIGSNETAREVFCLSVK
jgi:hypothetical protein